MNVKEKHFSSWKWALIMLRHFVTLVVHKVCDVLKVVTLVSGVTVLGYNFYIDAITLQHSKYCLYSV